MQLLNISKHFHFQIKIPKRGQAKAKDGQMLPPAPLKETLQMLFVFH